MKKTSGVTSRRKILNLRGIVNGRVDAMVSVMVSQLLDTELSWPEYRVEFLSIHTGTSAGILILGCQGGDAQKRLAYTSHIRRLTRRPNGGQILALPNPHYRPGDSADRGV